MEIREFEYILSVIRNRSFSAAAAELHISQPALSKYVASLERRLGLKLLERTNKGLVPTYAGERCYACALEVSERMERWRAEMEGIAAMQKNRLRVGVIRNDRQYFLPQNIERFRERYPDIELNITQQLSKDIESGILNGRLDIGFVSEPSIPGSVDYRTLGKNYTLLAAPAAMGLAAEGAEKEPLPFPWIDIHLLDGAAFVLQDESCRFRGSIDDFFEHENFFPKIKMTTQSTVDALRFTELGVGPSLISDGYIHYLSLKEKVDIFCVGTPPATTNFGVIAKNLAALPKCAVDFIDIYMTDQMRS